MKTNISEVSYANPSINQEGSGWWSWDEYCDRCGKVIHTKSILHSCPQDEYEPSFCNECYRYFIDNNISCEQAIADYPVGKHVN